MERAHHLWFKKPRPIYWEHLFFGRESPLAVHFSAQGKFGRKISDYIFNLETQIENDWLGYSKAVHTADKVTVTEEHFYSFGVILAYCYFFGIRDLHRFNLIFTPSHLQVIDAEVVLTNLTLPNETLLLPFKDIAFDLCGLSHLAATVEAISEENKLRIFEGYFDACAIFHRNQRSLFDTLNSSVKNVPVRVIIRNTKEYRKHLTGKEKITDLFFEESEQLARGDIPYFFKRPGSTALYWISDEENRETNVEEFDKFAADVQRHASTAITLVGDTNVIERKMVQGAFIMQKHLRFNRPIDFSWNGGTLNLSSEGLVNRATGREFLRISKIEPKCE